MVLGLVFGALLAAVPVVSQELSLEELERQLKQRQAEAAKRQRAQPPRAASPAAAAGGVFRGRLRTGGEGPQMVRVAGGRFEQGSPS